MNNPYYVPPPSGAELPYDDGEPLESNRHRVQMNLLIDTLELAWTGRDDFFAGGNMFLYYSALQAKKNDYRGPDVFVVLGTEHKDRRSWVVWEEDGKTPDVIIELTSPSTEAIDRGPKKHIYGTLLRVPEYYIYDPFSGELEGFSLDANRVVYTPIERNPPGRLPVSRVELELGVWHGSHLGVEAPWLRWFRVDGTLLETGHEARNAEAKRRIAAEQQRAQAEQRASDLAARLAGYERRFGQLPE